MSKIFNTLLAVLFLFCANPQSVSAITDPLSVPNNRFGIHILNEGDIEAARALVNSFGDWGYVTLVIPDNDRNTHKWQNIFNILREKHLIPIVRIATHPEGQNWVKPAVGEAPAWASFLDSLNWVVKNRYVVIFNEPNHAKEWGGQVAPSEYADILSTYAEKLKEQNDDFFVLNAGFDSSASNSKETRDQASFIHAMISHNPNVFKDLDGWVSHSYPNPGFSASPQKTGRASLKNYEWEIQLLKNLGVKKELPIFITETGWSNASISETKVAENFRTAYVEVWNDPKILAVTPFVLDYQAEPFSNFSWKKKDGFKEHYLEVQSLGKTIGQPEQIEKIVILDGLPEKFTINNLYFFTLSLENLGQTIWEESRGYSISIDAPTLDITVTRARLEKVKPFEIYKTGVSIKTPPDGGEHILKVSLLKNGQVVSETSIAIILEGPPETPQTPQKNNFKNFFEFILNNLRAFLAS